MKRGFSLVELSIVLVILGLLTGGILTGQTLIRAAELRSISTEFQRYQSAVHTFRDKYFALPGDMRNATDFWGAVDGNDGLGSDCYTANSTNALTCNGDGDGEIDTYTGQSIGGMEAVRFWQHLANAGLIEGQFTGAPNGVVTADNRLAARGVNVPTSKLGQAAWWASYAGNITSTSAYIWPGNHGNVFIFGNVEPTDITEIPALRPEEAWNIDTKLDDGKPGTGSLLIYRNLTNCHTSNDGTNPSGSDYQLSSSDIECFLFFSNAF